MRICVPTMSEGGLTGRLASHFGRAPYFTYWDEATGDVTVAANGNAEHEHGGCAPAAWLAEQRLGAVICQGLGRGAHARLTAAGVKVYVSSAPDVAGALAEWRAGQLAEAAADGLCRGHGGGH